MTNHELNTLIKEHGLTTARIAELLKVSIGAVNKWRNGQRRISEATQEYIKLVLKGHVGKVK